MAGKANGTIELRLPPVRPEALSDEQLQVATLLSAGRELDVIAQAMETTRAGVEEHCRSIYRILGISERATLIRWAMYYDIGRW